MDLVIAALKDVKAGVYMSPFFVPTLSVAVRSISDEIKRGGDGNTLSAHPSDFQLWTLGVYDNASGVILSEPKLEMDCSVLTGG